MQPKSTGGIICPIATPLDDEERLDVASLRRLLDRILPDIDGLLVLGSTGEFAFLKEEVADQMVEATLDVAGGKLPIYLGCSDTGTRRAIAQIRRAQRAGVDYVVATSPFYYPISDQEALIGHFTAIAEASPLPVILYNIPQNTAVNLTPASVQRLAGHPNIVGLKDSWGDMFQFQEFIAARPPGFLVMQGREQLAALSLWAGADGIVSAIANFAPRMLRRILKAVRANEREEALRAQRAVTELARVFDQGYWLSGLNATLHELGIGNGRGAQPVPICTETQVATIRQILRQAQLIPSVEKSHD